MSELVFTPDNTIVIGSGILTALNLRESKDIDIVIVENAYPELVNNSDFRKEQNHGNEVLVNGIFEIGIYWNVLGKKWYFEDLLKHSIIIDQVRYLTIQFLLDVKRSWIANGTVRSKDVEDIKLMEKYLAQT